MQDDVVADFGIDAKRIIGFSDAVFAFAITLLVLKIDLPNIDPATASVTLMHELIKLWPQYVANIISFLVIGYYWLIHHRLFLLIKKYDTTLIWLNIFLLMAISFLPFPTDLLGSYGNEPVTISFYALNLFIVGILIFIIWEYASYKYRLIDKSTSKVLIKYYTLKSLIAPIIFAASIPLSFIHPLLAEASWAVVFLVSATYKHNFEQINHT